jgi:hypothetical protein
VRPSTARELWTQLVALFPGFARYHSLTDVEEAERDQSATLHSVMIPFTDYFGSEVDVLSEKQLKALGTFVNEAAQLDDDWENAVSTCFLEHLRQIKSYRVFTPYLSAPATTCRKRRGSARRLASVAA